MPLLSGKETGKTTELLIPTIRTAPSPSQTTGRVLNSAPSHGNAEELDSAREEDGVLDMMVAKEPHSQTKLQVLPPTIDHAICFVKT